MKTVLDFRSVAYMAEQFQSVSCLDHHPQQHQYQHQRFQVFPLPPQSQLPVDESILSETETMAQKLFHNDPKQPQDHGDQRNTSHNQFNESEHFAKLNLPQQHSHQPMLEPILSQQPRFSVQVAKEDKLHPLIMSPTELTGQKRLLNDLQRLMENSESADIVFLVGSNEVRVYAHRTILLARCRPQKNDELYKIFALPETFLNGKKESVIHWPQAQPDALKNVLGFVYTGKITVYEKDIFEVLAIGSELGLDELIRVYEAQIKASLSVHNACQYLDSMVRLQPRLNDFYCNRIMQLCMQFISENAAECSQTQAFINMSKSGITNLVSSDYFSLDEADVFRRVLAWAQHQTGVLSSPNQWRDEERARMSEQLTGVIHYIRILLIDSKMFAEEVEPTGVVPIELSLERYRFEALHKPEHNWTLKQAMQPRVPLSTALLSAPNNGTAHTAFNSTKPIMFSNSKLLGDFDVTEEKAAILNDWFGVRNQSWKLIFRASNHNFSAEAFHNFCDGVAPTYTLVLGSNGHLSGGFSDVPWSVGDGKGRGRYVSSDKAFLFSLRSVQDSVPVRFDVKKKMFAVAHNSHFGPIFGAGADLAIADQCNHNDESYSNLPHSYDGENASCTSLFGDYNFSVVDYEVFTLADKV